MNAKVQIIVAVLLAAAGAALTFGAADAAPQNIRAYLGEPARYGLFIAAGTFVITALFTAIFGLFAGLGRGEGRERARAQRALDAFHEILTGATVRMVGADGVVSPAEISMVSSVLQKFGQTPVAEETIRSIARAAHANPDRYLNLIKEKSDILTVEQKNHILRGCLLVAMADVMIDPAELEYLRQVADALELPEETIASVRQELENVAQQLVGAAAFAA